MTRPALGKALVAAALFAVVALAGVVVAGTLAGCGAIQTASPVAVPSEPGTGAAPSGGDTASPASLPERESTRGRQLALAAMAQVGVTVSYDARYVLLPYPGGDVASSTGVCSDVVIRAYRGVGVDLQVKVHQDMLANFSAYPQKWGLSRPDSNIDHRRVPNLQTYFLRHGAQRPITQAGADYWPGDVVTWSVNGAPHVGIVSTQPTPDGERFMIVHNIRAGAQVEDVLFAYPITGHFRSF